MKIQFNSNIFIPENAIESVVCEMAAIFLSLNVLNSDVMMSPNITPTNVPHEYALCKPGTGVYHILKLHVNIFFYHCIWLAGEFADSRQSEERCDHCGFEDHLQDPDKLLNI